MGDRRPDLGGRGEEQVVTELRLLTTLEELEAAGEGWDDLVRSMRRPSPWLLHAWVTGWWRHYGASRHLRVHAAFRDGRLVAALPLFVERRLGVRVLDFVGHFRAAPVDVLVAGDAHDVVPQLVERASTGDHELADFFGLHDESRLAAALHGRLRLVRRVESPFLDLTGGWDDVYRAHTDSKKRNLHKRRRRQLAGLGRLETTVARSPAEVGSALEEAFDLHRLRWSGRPDGSGFATPTGRRFHAEAAGRLAEADVARIVTLRLDGRPIAFHYYFAFCGRMFVHRLAFDPSLARYSPGLVNTLDALETAAGEGLERVEYLGGGERYKLELSDGLHPLYEGFGLARSLRGHALLRARLGEIGARQRLKRSARVRRWYFEGLAPLRRRVPRRPASR